MSGQLESRHFFQPGDVVRSLDGRQGTVDEAWALYARIRWEDGSAAEVDQFDPEVVVLRRAAAG